MRYVTTHERFGFERGLKQGIQEGFQQGLQQGLQQGKEFWRMEDLREAILDVLRERFAALPDDVALAISAISQLPALKGILRCAATAASLKEFQDIVRQKTSAGLRQ